MNVGSPLHGVHFGFGLSVIDPVTVPGALRIMYYNIPYPQKTNVATGDNAANGDAVCNVSDRQNPSGLTFQDREYNGVANTWPVVATGGLQFGTDTFNDISAYNSPVQMGISSFTGYFWGTYDGGSVLVFLGNTNSTMATIVIGSDSFTFCDDDGNFLNATDTIAEGHVLCRVSYDAVTGDSDIRATGATPSIITATPGSSFKFDTVANSPIIGFSNSSLLNRYLGSLLYDHVIPFGDATDLGIRQYIINNYGAGYALDATPSPPPDPNLAIRQNGDGWLRQNGDFKIRQG